MTIAVLFPGQGSQHAGMADPWMEHEASRSVIEQASEAVDLDLVASCNDEAMLATTEVAQPALFACDLAAFAVLDAEGTAIEAAAGHSLGEFAALVAAGVLDLVPALHVVVERGRAMQAASDERPGTMTALIGLSAEEGAEICDVAGRGDVLQVANENGPKQVVLSGSVEAIGRAEEQARSRGARAIRLQVAGAFHSPLMEAAVERIRAALAEIEFREPRFPVVANVSGKIISEPSALRDLLARHVVSPVRWQRSMETLGKAGFATFVEAGPGDVLSKLTKRIVPGARAFPVGGPDDAKAFAAGVVEEGAG